MIGSITEQHMAGSTPYDIQKNQPKVYAPKTITENENATYDVVEFTEDSKVYAKLGIDKPVDPDIKVLLRKAEASMGPLRNLIEALILRQVKATQNKDIYQSLLTDSDFIKAEESISEDGEYGVAATSDRIVQFAIGLSGGDKAKFNELRDAIDVGFTKAATAMGGNLPDICRQTYNETIRKLEEWSEKEEAQA